MKMLSSFAHPPMLLQTCMSFFLLLNTKIILKNVANQTVDSIAIEFQVVWLPTFSKISFLLCSTEERN